MQVYLPNQSFIKIIYSEPYAGLPSQSIKYALKVYTQGRMQVQHWPVPNKPPRFCGRKAKWSGSCSWWDVKLLKVLFYSHAYVHTAGDQQQWNIVAVATRNKPRGCTIIKDVL